jgi:hypothetical protein
MISQEAVYIRRNGRWLPKEKPVWAKEDSPARAGFFDVGKR